MILRRENFQTNYIQISDIQISPQYNKEDNVENWLIQAFKVKWLFKRRHVKNPLPLSITQCNKIYSWSPPCSDLWVSERGQNHDIWLKSFELQNISQRVIITPIIGKKRSLHSSLLLMDSKWIHKSNNENNELLVF